MLAPFAQKSSILSVTVLKMVHYREPFHLSRARTLRPEPKIQ